MFLQLTLINAPKPTEMIGMGKKILPCDFRSLFLQGPNFSSPSHMHDLCLAALHGQLALPTGPGARGTRLPPLSLLVRGAYTKCCYSGLQEIF